MKAVEVAGDIAASASAASGLVLVYLGALSASYAAYDPRERKSVRRSYNMRGWFAFVGLVLFVVAVVASLVGKWSDYNASITVALVCLLAGFMWVVAIAVLTLQEIG